LLVANVLHYTYLGAQYTICQGVASARSRATAVAIMLFVVNLIGYGLGPIFVGFLSDMLMSGQLESVQGGSVISAQACDGTQAELLETLGAAQTEACQSARAQGLGQSIIYTVTLYAVGGLLYLITCKTLQKDLTSKLT
jgi:hypothetical protein